MLGRRYLVILKGLTPLSHLLSGSFAPSQVKARNQSTENIIVYQVRHNFQFVSREKNVSILTVNFHISNYMRLFPMC